MFDDLSRALKNVLTQPGLPSELAAADVTFDRPKDDPAPATPTVNLFLYDLRENLDLRETEPDVSRNGGKVTVRPAPDRIDCSYIVTAWAAAGADVALKEQQLLGQVWRVLARHPTVPEAFLPAALKAQPYPIPLTVSRSESARGLSEFWTALGLKLRPSLTVTATLALVSEAAGETGPEVKKAAVQIGEWNPAGDLPPAAGETRFTVAGRVRKADDTPAVGAVVAVAGTTQAATADGEGRYAVGHLAAGGHTFRVTLGAAAQTFPVTVTANPNETYDLKLT